MTAGFIPEAGAFLIGAGERFRTAGEGAEVRTGFAVVIHGGCAGEAGCGAGIRAHGAAVHISVTGIGFYLVMFLTVTAETGFSVLYVAVGDGGVIVAGAGIAAGAVRTVV